MPEHLIRLRAAWQRRPLLEPAQPPAKADLPIAWPPGLVGGVSLTRSFNAPRLDRTCETLELRLENVPGLLAARLNGLELAGPHPGTSMLRIAVDLPLPRRNELVLEVDPACAAAATGAESGWGHVALAVRSTSDS